MMRTLTLYLCTGILFLLFSCTQSHVKRVEDFAVSFRAPAYPLITIDPYTSAWSETDTLFDSPVKHWTGKIHSLIGAIRVDGNVYRFMGKENIPLKTLVPMAGEEAWQGKYTTKTPVEDWETSGFNDLNWRSGKAAFGTSGMKAIGTEWNTKEIWVRREFFTPKMAADANLYLIYSHDDDFELYLNGKEIVNTGHSAKSDILLKIDPKLLNKDGKNVLAGHCTNTGGLAYVDFGLYTDGDQKEVFTRTATQNSVSLSATQTHYSFTAGPVNLDVQFVAPLLPNDLDLLSRPIDYINYQVTSNDGAKHNVQLYFEITPQWAVNDVSQEVQVNKGETGNIDYVKAGTTEQPILKKKGDNVRIDWGYVYLAAGKSENSSVALGNYFETKTAFAENGKVPSGQNELTAKMNRSMPAMACVENLGQVSQKTSDGYVMIGYNDIESIQYFGTNLKAWWTHNGTITFNDALQSAAKEHDQVIESCDQFDNKLWKETLVAGGKKYADLCVLAYRQSIAAHKLVKDPNGNILFLSKENFSNGSIGTVDVTYPSAPLFLYYNPELLKGMLNPIFYYSESGKWTKPFAAHDVGTYPKANGQTYGGDMPVEECGNMIILTTAIGRMEGNADYAAKHWKVLTTWANYLLENGLDPENQLCTDDFAGHFAHNTNLSVKAIMGIEGYGKLAEMLGKTDIAKKYTSAAKKMAQRWQAMANDGDHYRLTFDKPGTWSQKYNLVWDKLLEFNIFPKEVAKKEIAYYLTKQNQYGLPLDNRKTYTKADWIVWTATLADNQGDFEQFTDRLHRFVTETPDRVPMTDWYETTNARQVGFQARSVVGGYFIKMLEKETPK
jgi:hypothetical protein